MYPERKRESVPVNCHMVLACLVMITGCGNREPVAPANPPDPLKIVAIVPTPGASDVPIEAMISVTFSSVVKAADVNGSPIVIDGVLGDICCLDRTTPGDSS